MALRNVVVEGDDILRKKCRPVDEVNDRIRMLLDDMLETMRSYDGVGIAAPQVGILRRLFVAEPEPGRVIEIINPVLLESQGEQTCDEGCLSVPGYVGTVTRPQYVKFSGLDRDGKKIIVEGTDFDAVVLSHEYDHLEGILYTDKATNVHELSDEEADEEEEECE